MEKWKVIDKQKLTLEMETGLIMKIVLQLKTKIPFAKPAFCYDSPYTLISKF